MKDTDFGKQVGIGAIGRAVGAAVAFGGSIVIAREIGDANYGVFYLMMTVSAVLDNPITGWTQACRKRFTEADWDDSSAIGAMFLMVVIGSVTVLIVSGALSLTVGEVRGVDPIVFWILFTGIIFFQTATSLVKGTSQFGSATWVNAVRDIIRVGLQITLVFLLADVLGMVLGIVAANLLLTVLVVWKIGTPSLPSRSEIMSVWQFARSSIPSQFIGTTMFRMDILLLGGLATSALVGNYQVAKNLTMPALFIGGILGAGMMSQISHLDSTDQAVVPQIRSGISYASIAAIPICAGSLVMGDLVAVTAYSQKFSRAGIFIGALGIYRVFQSQYQTVANAIRGLDRPDLTLRANGIGLVLNIVLGLVGYWLIGPAGIAWATVLSIVCRYAYISQALRSLVDMSTITRPLIHQMMSGAIMGATVWMGRQQLPGGWIWVGALVGLGGVVYFTSLWTLSEDFRSLTLSFVPV
jgi:O-antigen/teichoic acid export membrane protein